MHACAGAQAAALNKPGQEVPKPKLTGLAKLVPLGIRKRITNNIRSFAETTAESINK